MTNNNYKMREIREYSLNFGISYKDAYLMLEAWNYSSVLYTFLSQITPSEIGEQIKLSRRRASYSKDPLYKGVIFTRVRKIHPCLGGGYVVSSTYCGGYYRGKKSPLCGLC